ncbi:MAG: TonB-dependent receptor [Gemmatimonadota bacterium]
MIRSLVLLLVLPVAAALAAESASLSGKVTDARGRALAGVNVTVTGGSLQAPAGAISDADGRYTVANLPAGQYAVRASHVGYRAATESGVDLAAGRTRSLDFKLEETVIYLEQSVVSASRIQEKALDAPASVAVVESSEIRDRPALNVAEQIRDLPGVDFAKNGLVQSNTVVRGFNNIFSGAMLTLTDNRIARVPALRINVTNFIPATSDDIDRIEVVLGPGSALYGPNSANGVMHIITKSPLASEGITAQVGLGERSLRRGAVRVARAVTPELGVKLSAQYYTGTDWKYLDPEEEKAKQREAALVSDPTQRVLRDRDFDISKESAEARIDYQPTDDLTAIVSMGYNNGDYIELTGLGAAQAVGWTYNYLQTRVRYRGLFAQYYHNWNDAGDTYLLRTGEPMVDKSTLDVFQVQHRAELHPRQAFTYGVDALLTRPNTGGTIYGQNESDDDINEYGLYVQSETDLTDQLDLVLALRYDTHNRLDDPVFSPRAALLYKPRETQTFRATYNRAFSTPTTVNLYLDLLTLQDPLGLQTRLQAQGISLPFVPRLDLRAQGTYRDGFDPGFTFRGSQTAPDFRSPFAPAAGLGMDTYIPMANTDFAWGILRGVTLQGLVPAFQAQATALIAAQLIQAGVDATTAQATAQQQAAAVAAGIPGLIPQSLPSLEYRMLTLNLQKAQSANALERAFPFDVTTQVHDVPRTKPTITQTLELGYKGIVGGSLVLAADAYRTTTEDFVGPLAVETPNVFLDPATLAGAAADLQTSLTQSLADPANAQMAAVLGALDAPSLGGNGNGTAADELTARVFTPANQQLFASIPFGTVSPEQAYDPTAMILTYRNFGDVTHYGLDLSAGYYPNDIWSITANYSFASKDLFRNVGGIADVALNAPKHKAKLGATYRVPRWDTRVGARVRYNGSFPMKSGVYEGPVDSYTTLDLNAVYDLPFHPGLSLLVNVDNVLNKEYRGFLGAPEIGRLAYVQLGVVF